MEGVRVSFLAVCPRGLEEAVAAEMKWMLAQPEFVLDAERTLLRTAVEAHKGCGAVVLRLWVARGRLDAPGVAAMLYEKHLRHLRSPDNLFVYLCEGVGVVPDGKEEGLACLENLAKDPANEFELCFDVWKEIALKGLVAVSKIEKDQKMFKFRVTAVRDGEKHEFKSPDVGGYVGSGIYERCPEPKWGISMTKHDIEVYCLCFESSAWMGFSLTRYGGKTHVDLYKRHREHLGPTTMKCSIAWGMAWMAGTLDEKSHLVLLDPMCGAGTIPIEVTDAWPGKHFSFGGDLDTKVVDMARLNCTTPVDFMNWSTAHLPIRSGTIDAIVCDLPYGQRCGSRAKNEWIYNKGLLEFGRVLRPNGEGKAVLITYSRAMMDRILEQPEISSLLRKTYSILVDNSGLLCEVYFLQTVTQTDSA